MMPHETPVMDGEMVPIPLSTLIAEAAALGMRGLTSRLIESPGEANNYRAVTEVTVQTEQLTCTALGEAQHDAVPVAWRPYLVTLAETRGTARALRALLQLASHQSTQHTAIVGARPSAARTIEEMLPPAIATPTADDLSAPAPAPLPRSAGSAIITDPIGRETMTTLLRLTTALAEQDGIEYTDDEMRERLNGFFVRAFGHGLERATRLEGQRVLQRLAADQARMQHMSPAERVPDPLTLKRGFAF